jgi:hypothetical protein
MFNHEISHFNIFHISDISNTHVMSDLTILALDVVSALDILIMWDAFEAIVVHTGHLGIEIFKQGLHGAIENSQHLLRFI